MQSATKRPQSKKLNRCEESTNTYSKRMHKQQCTGEVHASPPGPAPRSPGRTLSGQVGLLAAPGQNALGTGSGGLLRCESQRNARGRGTHAAVDDPAPEMQGPYVMSPPPIPLERFLLIPCDGRHSGAGGISGDHQQQRLGGESMRHKDQGLGSRQAPASIRRPADERSANLAGAWSSAALHDGAKHPAVTATPSGTPVATGSG